MSQDNEPIFPRAITDQVRARWVSFLLLGLALTLMGVLAIALPVVSSLATSLTVGLLLAVGGVTHAVQAFWTRDWQGFLWNLALGIIQIVGGALIYMQPFAGAVAITMLVAVVLLVQGATQSALAFRVRPHDGWGWLLLSGLVAILVGVLLATHLPAASLSTPGIMVGIALIFSGMAYLAIALAARRIVKLMSAP
ncbi:MAG: HdeD family acid-resistance protein [Alphaproteobacteria bacterium]|nr:HdeD family acid-resistance protein [Alphaproteobacteria bacterium]